MDNWQWTLHPHHLIRVWRPGRYELLAELPVTLLMHIIAHYLAGADLTAVLLEGPRRPMLPAPRRAPPLPLGPAPEALRASRRQQRRSRKRTRSRDSGAAA